MLATAKPVFNLTGAGKLLRELYDRYHYCLSVKKLIIMTALTIFTVCNYVVMLHTHCVTTYIVQMWSVENRVHLRVSNTKHICNIEKCECPPSFAVIHAMRFCIFHVTVSVSVCIIYSMDKNSKRHVPALTRKANKLLNQNSLIMQV